MFLQAFDIMSTGGLPSPGQEADPPQKADPPKKADPHSQRVDPPSQKTDRRHTSYWNAYLFFNTFTDYYFAIVKYRFIFEFFHLNNPS